MKSWVEVSAERLRSNFHALREAAGDELVRWPDGGNYPEVTVLAVVKANAYGHDAALCAGVLRGAGAEWLGVTDVAEGVLALEGARRGAFRFMGPGEFFIPRVGPPPKILIMCGFEAEEAATIVQHGLVPVVWRVDHLRTLAAAIGRKGLRRPLPVHVEIDTGMSRQGCLPGAELAELLGFFLSSEGRVLRCDGVFTHFASSEVAGASQTREQERRFEQALEQVSGAGLKPRWVHAGNSSTVDEGSSLEWLKRVAARAEARALLRTGLGLYGYTLPIEGDGGSRVRPHLQPVMTWKARVMDLREVQPGATVGYNGIFKVERPTRLALLPVGYADGLRRELSGGAGREGGWVMLHGQRAPIAGRVSMNLTMVDVTGIEGVRVGDDAVVLGEGVSAEDHAAVCHTIAYEICCGAGARLPRKVVDEGSGRRIGMRL